VLIVHNVTVMQPKLTKKLETTLMTMLCLMTSMEKKMILMMYAILSLFIFSTEFVDKLQCSTLITEWK